jgi:hypothetical protein
MRVFRDPKAVNQVEDAALRQLLARRFDDLCQGEPYDPLDHGYFVLVEPGDTVEALEAETGCPIVSAYLDGGACYGEPGFEHSFECLEEHPFCFEMAFVLDDGGFGVVLLIPKVLGMDAELLRLCEEYAELAPPVMAD